MRGRVLQGGGRHVEAFWAFEAYGALRRCEGGGEVEGLRVAREAMQELVGGSVCEGRTPPVGLAADRGR